MKHATGDQKPTLVLGSTGKTGRRVVERLTARGVPTRLGVRSAVPRFDWEDRSTWAPVLQGVGAVYVTYYPDLAAPGAVDKVSSFAEVAVASGVPRLVLLSGRGEHEAEQAEDAVRSSGADLTVVRSTWFAQNFSEMYWVEYVQSGLVALPAGEVPEPFVDVDDIADVAVAALTEDGHSGQLYELTGPRLLTFADAVAEIAEATGREIEYMPVSVEEHAAAAAAQGVPQDVIDLLTYLFGTVLDGRNAYLADGVQRALGREPRDFAEYAAGGGGHRRVGRAGHGSGCILIDGWLFALTLVTALGSALVAGVFFAFSSFVMRALGRLPSPAGLAAMQSMNTEAPTPWFMTALFGTAAGCVVLVASSLIEWGEQYAPYLLVGGAMYLVGAVGLTIAYHVPHNNRLAALEPTAPGSSSEWTRYLSGWTAWNHVRSVAALAAAAILVGGVRAG